MSLPSAVKREPWQGQSHVPKTAVKTVSAPGHSGSGYTFDEKIAVALYYLQHDEGLIQVEENHMNLIGRHGATAKYILNRLGVDTGRGSKHRGLLSRSGVTIDDEIGHADGTFKITLEEIKKRSF